MNPFQHRPQSVTLGSLCLFPKALVRASIVLFTLAVALAARAQTTPKLLSVTPADGATGVPINSAVVFVFDQNMNTLNFPFASFPPLLVGNFEIQPTNLFFNGKWETDKRTLTITCTKVLPFDTLISWTLNPPAGTNFSFPPLASASTQVLATVSGSFRTVPPPPPPPKLLSVTPTNGATEVPLNSPLTFVFDQEMDTATTLIASTPFLIGNYQFTPSTVSTQFVGFWSADKRTLTFQGSTPIALSTPVTWRLNPIGTTAPLKSAFGQLLATTNGSFTVLTTTGGNANEVCPTNTSVGYYSLTKTLQHRQISASVLVPSAEAPASFITFVQSPPLAKGNNGRVTNGSITLPNSTVLHFTNQFVEIITIPRTAIRITNVSGNLGVFDSKTTEAALESVYPAGGYTMRFDQAGEPVVSKTFSLSTTANDSRRLNQPGGTGHVIPMNMPATPASIPTISNYDEGQAIDAAQNFTLRWNSFSPQVAGAFINLMITDEFGKLIFQAPNVCLPRTLASTATSIVIPANYFRAELNYDGLLQFGFNFYNSTNDVPQMAGNGTVQRITSFTLKTTLNAGGTGTALPVTFTGYRFLPSGHPQLDLSGTAGKSYTIQRTGTLTNPSWTPAGPAIMTANGTAVFEDIDATLKLPVFYRAVELNTR